MTINEENNSVRTKKKMRFKNYFCFFGAKKGSLPIYFPKPIRLLRSPLAISLVGEIVGVEILGSLSRDV